MNDGLGNRVGYLCVCRCVSSCRTFGGIFCRSRGRGRGGCRCGSAGAWTGWRTAWSTSHTACTQSFSPGCGQPGVGPNWRHVQKSCYRSHTHTALTRCVTFVRELRVRAACWRICCTLRIRRPRLSILTKRCRQCFLLPSRYGYLWRGRDRDCRT